MTEVGTGAATRTWTRRSSFLLVAVAYVIASAVFVVVAEAIERAEWSIALGYLASTLVLYGVSQAVGNGSTFDAWWSVMPAVATVWLVITVDHPDETGLPAIARLTALVLVLAWGARLTGNWALSWTGLDHEDWRYRHLYATTPMPRWATSLLAVHLFPTAIVALASQPIVALMSHQETEAGWPALGSLFFAAGTVVTAGSVAIEHLADVELRAFNRTKQPGDLLDSGWWSRSRHPNYLGETGFWWGTGLLALSVDQGAWWTLAGPVAITVMFVTASIPMLETRSAERRPGWAEYAARTPALVPRLRRR